MNMKYYYGCTYLSDGAKLSKRIFKNDTLLLCLYILDDQVWKLTGN